MWLKKRYPKRRMLTQIQVIRGLKRIKLNRRQDLHQVWAVAVVRDESDVIGAVVDHLLDQGVDGIIIADHGSRDGTYEILSAKASEDSRVHVLRDRTEAHFQSEKVSWLAHLAWRAGASWIVPFDADEFWFARGMKLADWLRALPRNVTLVHAAFHHMVPVATVGELTDREFVLDAAVPVPGKVAVRAHPLMEIWPGNHHASHCGDEAVGLHIAHAQYRSASQVARKLRQGAAAARATGHDPAWFSPHWEAGASLADTEVAEVFTRISQGLADDRIDFKAIGPMIKVRPLRWSTWDPDGQVAAAQSSSHPS